jgi:hypothetical protein
MRGGDGQLTEARTERTTPIHTSEGEHARNYATVDDS